MSEHTPRWGRVITPLAVCTLAAGVVATAGGAMSSAAPGKPPLTREQVAQSLLDHHARFGTGAQVLAWNRVVGKRAGTSPLIGGEPAAGAARRGAPSPMARSGALNVRVNDPSTDTEPLDQTTQNETALAVSGRDLVVGYNDSHQATPFFTAAVDLSGYATSSDGGRSFRDRGTIPNLQGYLNVGDPWLASGAGRDVYYSTLAIDGESGNLEVGVAKSSDGGRTFAAPTIVSPNDPTAFYSGDKEAITSGRAPGHSTGQVQYVAWDDFSFDFTAGTANAGLPVARSADGGASWQLSYADRIAQDPLGCSFGQFLGAQPHIDPADGTLTVFAERIAVNDPDCTGGTLAITQVVYTSTDGGLTFGPAVTIAPVTPSVALRFAKGQIMRTAEFPTVAQIGSTLYAAWNDGSAGKDHIKIATSTDRGRTWNVTDATTGDADEVQPQLSADEKGLHLAYYVRNADATLDLALAHSPDGTAWTARKVTTRSFPGVDTAPQFDPIIAAGYMGDYVANVSSGGRQYLAWGDNRDVVRNVLWPNGRQDPNVYFAVTGRD